MASATNTKLKQQAHHTTQADIITVQETKLTKTSKTPIISNYTPIHTDRVRKLGGLPTYIKHNMIRTKI